MKPHRRPGHRSAGGPLWSRPVHGARGRLRAFAVELESSLASPEAAARWVAAQPPGLRRTMTTTLVERAVANPELTGRLIRRNLPAGLRYLGVGYHSIVYQSADGKVIKVNRRTIHVSEARREQFAAAERRAHEVVLAYLGDIPIPQEIVVGVHPASPHLRAVMIVQDYCAYADLDEVFPSGHDSVDASAVERLVGEHLGIGAALRRFARGGLAMAEEERLVPDICGRGNVGLVMLPRPRLVLIDGQPMSAAKKAASRIVIPQLRSLLERVGDADQTGPAG